MSGEFEILKEAFRQEALELLSELEASLLELEKAPGDGEAVSSVFRVFHSLKGSGATCGFDEVSQFTHHIETAYDLVRNGKMPVDKTLIDLTLRARDLLHDMIDARQSDPAEAKGQGAEILSEFRALMPGAAVVPEPQAKNGGEEAGMLRADSGKRQITYRIRLRPSSRIFADGTNPISLMNELRRLGECRIVAQSEEIPFLDEIDPEQCYTRWDAVLTTDRDVNAIRDVFIFIEDQCELKIETIDDGTTSLEETDYRKLGEILVEKRDLSEEELGRVLRDRKSLGRKSLGEILVEEGLVAPLTVEAALVEQEHVRELRERRLREEVISSLRVSSEKLDRLVNLVGELVTVQARLTLSAADRDDPGLVSIAEEVERLTADLRDNTMSIRLLPLGTTFSKFKRLVRDLSLKLGKEVELLTEGGETELDKTVIEKLNDPLVHLIRNSIDHGIEPPEIRERAGKPRKGTVSLSAVHSGSYVVIQVRDDGAGVDAELVRAKAVENGLISQDAALSEKDLLPLILAPGFTTAGNVTSVSGRGVGMDVVKKAVDRLRGTIEISSRKGEGTTVTLVLPLTLAIIDGLLVSLGAEYFVLPLSAVEECVELTGRDKENAHGRQVANVRGQIVPYVRLRDHFTIGGHPPDIEQIVIVRNDHGRAGFVVDSVIGEHQTVIKSLGRVFRDIEGISGATILGSGNVALIVDIPKLIRIAEEEEVSRVTG